MSANLGQAIKGLVQNADTYLEHPAREVATKGWNLWIKAATGDEANVRRTKEINYIEWKPGQAQKFSDYFNSLFFAPKSDEPEQRGMGFGEVSINWKPVYMPIVYKKVLPVLAAYSVLAFMAGWYIKGRKK